MKHQNLNNISITKTLRVRIQNTVAHSTFKFIYISKEHYLVEILVIEDTVVVSKADLSQNPPLWL